MGFGLHGPDVIVELGSPDTGLSHEIETQSSLFVSLNGLFINQSMNLP